MNTQDNLYFLERGAFQLNPRLLLYQDGQLIIGDDRGQLLEKRITSKELDDLIFNLGQLGLFELKETYAADIDNPIYDFPNVAPSYSGFGSGLISVYKKDERKSIRYMLDWDLYLIQPVKNIIYYLKHYSLSGMMPYQPDRLLVAIRNGREQPFAGDSAATTWPEGVISPLKRTNFDGVLFLEGEAAAVLFSTARGKSFQVFNYQGSEYSVFLRPIYPHECITREYFQDNSDSQSQQFFTCEDWNN